MAGGCQQPHPQTNFSDNSVKELVEIYSIEGSPRGDYE
jgi:hypothetical protein